MREIFMIELDLHSTSHSLAGDKIISFIETYFNSGNQLLIITGNSDVMRSLCLRIASEYGLKATIGSPYDGSNFGYVTIWT